MSLHVQRIIRQRKHCHQTNDLQNALITVLKEELLLYEPRHKIIRLCHLGTKKAQINLRIRAVCSTPFLFASYIAIYLQIINHFSFISMLI